MVTDPEAVGDARRRPEPRRRDGLRAPFPAGFPRDFIGLFFVLKTLGLDLEAFFRRYEAKYGRGGFNRHHILKSLIYFEDADRDPDPEMLMDFSWDDAKRFFVGNVEAFRI